MRGLIMGVGTVAPKGISQEEFESHEGSVVGDPMTESFHLDHDQEDERDEEKELNSFRISQLALAQLAISQTYEYPAHFSAPNLDAMNLEFSLGQRGTDDDPTAEFENKEEVLIAVNTYSISRVVQFKILESDQLKYASQCSEFGRGSEWSIHVSYRQKQEK
ncbi:hypothetical protein PIB30_028332 [Stylosanthes scabra]|uniref:Transposase MuDR plant domain-containing protein n=1 Tax=Stylosanthes scabra TaxID=79078 RepID=A0ABU6Z8Q6_9FABA|nr:hypothetical protein [Stylosanthes scabra]